MNFFPIKSRLTGLAALLLAAGTARAATTAPAAAAAAVSDVESRPTAIFVVNRVGEALADKVGMFQDLLSARVSGAGFSLIAPDTAVRALGPVASGGAPTAADAALENQSSALRLAQALGAQYVLVATLDSLGTDQRSFQGYGITVTGNETTLRVAYQLCDATQGASVFADSVKVSEKIPQTANLTILDKDLVNKLLDDAATSLGQAFVRKANGINFPMATRLPAQVDFSVACSMSDLVLPDILRGADGQYFVGPANYTVNPVDVTVSLNGLAMGSAPGTFKGPSGIGTMRLTRQGFKDWEEKVYLQPGFKLNVALQMTADGLARWQQDIAFLQGLKASAKLTDADVQRVLGIAESFRNSGLRVDQRSDVKVNATALPTVQQVYQSVWAPPPLPAAAGAP